MRTHEIKQSPTHIFEGTILEHGCRFSANSVGNPRKRTKNFHPLYFAKKTTKKRSMSFL